MTVIFASSGASTVSAAAGTTLTLGNLLDPGEPGLRCLAARAIRAWWSWGR